MTDTMSRPSATEEEDRAPRRRLLSRIPLWVRISTIIALILVGVFASSMLLGASSAGKGQGGGHGGSGGQGGGQMQMPHQGGFGQGGSGSTHGSGGSHDSRPGQSSRGSHSSGGGR
jgi:hypothetical protein